MELAGKTAVVTGGASGIGRAMAIRFAAEGARVVVADLDLDGAALVAEEAAGASAGGAAARASAAGASARIGDVGSAIAVACDVRDAAQIHSLVDEAEAAFGPVDLFCANAGIGGGHGLETPDQDWDDAFAVNVRAHVQAARRLVPGWLARAEGYFLSTASAAGLLTAIGSGPYTASKHAAVGFAEWLAITYGGRGIKVSCLCPMGVDTPLLAKELDRLGGQAIIAAGPLLTPDQVADSVVEGLREERFLILPHADVAGRELDKVSDRDAWLARMRAFQQQMLNTLEIPA
jgi:NAD(P)-dependent dehydrogenase (short-subunit alcohol dehydrogenase family)